MTASAPVGSIPKKTLTLTELVELHGQNPIGLAPSTLKIRRYLLGRFLESWPEPTADVATISTLQITLWLSERRKENSLKAQGVNNYIRALQGLFRLAVDAGVTGDRFGAVGLPQNADPLLRRIPFAFPSRTFLSAPDSHRNRLSSRRSRHPSQKVK